MRLLSLAIALICLAPLTWAACEGRDLRPDLTAEQSAQLEEMRTGRVYGAGNHWRAERDGELLHLVGTIHLDHAGLRGPVAGLTPVIENAALLLLEVTARERAALQAHMADNPQMVVLEGETLIDRLPVEEWARVAEAAQARGMPGFMAAKFRPWYLATLLSLPECISVAELARLNGLDMQLERIAQGAGVPTGALEDHLAAFSAFQAMPMEGQIMMLQAALMPAGLGEDILATLMAAYLEEAHVESWLLPMVLAQGVGGTDPEMEAEIWRLFEAKLLVERNRAWIPVIEAALAETDGPVVAAFGAAHLGGEEGVLRLLEKAGFRLERLAF